jgi:hypothetical protein
MFIYSVLDTKSESFSPPMVNRTKGEAIRSFSDEVNNPNSMLYKHPEDYVLFEIGTWDNQSGVIEAHQAPISCGTAIEFKDAENSLTDKAA